MSQCQWTIEARADCGDAEKEAIKNLIMTKCFEILTSLRQLPTSLQVEVRCYADDFFAGHKDFDLFAELAKSQQAKAAALVEDNDDGAPSTELIQAALAAQSKKRA